MYRLFVVLGILSVVFLVTACSFASEADAEGQREPAQSISDSTEQAETRVVETEVTRIVEVEVTRVVEVTREVVVTPTFTPALSAPPATPTPASSPQPVTITADVANLRAGPGTMHEVVGQLQRGANVEVVGINDTGDWYLICCIEEEASWLYADLVTQPHDPQVISVVTPPPPTPTPTKVISQAPGTRLEPVPIGETAHVLDEEGREVLITLTRAVRGREAQDIINRGKRFLISTPGLPDHEFYLTYFVVEYVRGPSDMAISVSSFDFFISVDNRLMPTVFTTFQDSPELLHTIYPGGRAEGWVPFQVPIGSNIQAILYSPDLLGTITVWFGTN